MSNKQSFRLPSAAYADFSTTHRCAEYVDAEPATAVTFFVVALTLGLLAYHVLSFIPVPYTALLLVRWPWRTSPESFIQPLTSLA